MLKLKRPNDYKIKTGKPSWFGPFGYHFPQKRLIEIYPPRWLPRWFGMRQWFIGMTLNHEYSHAYGVVGCPRPWCLSFEMHTWHRKLKDVWVERVVCIPFLIFNRFDFCGKHRKQLQNI